jgi:hypothetical protein
MFIFGPTGRVKKRRPTYMDVYNNDDEIRRNQFIGAISSAWPNQGIFRPRSTHFLTGTTICS